MSSPTLTPGSRYKFVVDTAAEAAAVIRDRLGPDARVLSVRNVPPAGLKRLWSTPQLEVIAEIPAAESGIVANSNNINSEETTDVAIGNKLPDASATGATTPEAAPKADFATREGRSSIVTPLAHSPRVSDLLRRAGFSETALSRLFARETDFAEYLPLPRALAQVEMRLRRSLAHHQDAEPLSRAAFIGPAGSGRTTALCKWLGREVFRHARTGHVVIADLDRANSPGQLPVFCEAMGVPVAHFPASTEPVAMGGFVYLDLPAFSLRGAAANRPLADFLDEEKIAQRVLVLNAAYDHATLRDAYATGSTLGATHVVFTHLDEVRHWERLWDYLADGALTPLFLATGPSLTGDCDEDVSGAILKQTFAGLPHVVADSTAQPQRSAA